MALIAGLFVLWKPSPKLTMLGLSPGCQRDQVIDTLGEPDFEVSGIAEYRTEEGRYRFFFAGDTVSYIQGPTLEVNGEATAARQLASRLGSPDEGGRFKKWYAAGLTVDPAGLLYLRPRQFL